MGTHGAARGIAGAGAMQAPGRADAHEIFVS
jgi:hypothetical protein